ncbi:MAG: glycosyltransferase [Chloroflexi bacterium]|nr:glycosyltransferase [Chloroflexota bacterium]
MIENTCEKTSDLPTNESSVQFTGIVVTYNEARRLRECLNSLAFCDQLIVVDLGSTDSSVEIAKEYGAEIFQHDRVQVVEDIHEKAASWASHDWIIFLDPDEVLPQGIERDLERLIANHPCLGVVDVPWQFYFKGKPVLSTVWGQSFKYKAAVRHRERVMFSTKVHRGYTLRPGYERIKLPRKTEGYYIKHYWVDSFSQMFAKHWRYIQREGEARYQSGERFWWRRWVRETWQALRQNLFDYGGLKGGFTGIFLSFFYAWYINMSLLSLWRYQRSIEKGHALSFPE